MMKKILLLLAAASALSLGACATDGWDHHGRGDRHHDRGHDHGDDHDHDHGNNHY